MCRQTKHHTWCYMTPPQPGHERHQRHTVDTTNVQHTTEVIVSVTCSMRELRHVQQHRVMLTQYCTPAHQHSPAAYCRDSWAHCRQVHPKSVGVPPALFWTTGSSESGHLQRLPDGMASCTAYGKRPPNNLRGKSHPPKDALTHACRVILYGLQQDTQPLGRMDIPLLQLHAQHQ
jgi:hypothetical protein